MNGYPDGIVSLKIIRPTVVSIIPFSFTAPCTRLAAVGRSCGAYNTLIRARISITPFSYASFASKNELNILPSPLAPSNTDVSQ